MRIGELAARSGVSVRALRYYEEQRLLTSTRSAGGQRLYGEHAVRQVELIQQLYAAGLASRTIAGLLPCVVTGEVTPELLDRLSAERDRIDDQLRSLQQARDRLDGIITTSSGSMTAGRSCAGVNAR